jgi:hypothetical protein
MPAPAVTGLEPVQVRLTGTPEGVTALAKRLNETDGLTAGGMTVRTRSARLVQGYLTIVIERNPDARPG